MPETTHAHNHDDDEDKFCPFVNDPKPECYIYEMDSMKIINALLFCQGNYKYCDIYQHYMDGPG